MKHDSAWLAAGLLFFVVLACSVGKKNETTNTGANSNSSHETSGNKAIYIEEIHMAKDDGKGEPGEKTDTFSPGDRTVHCVATLKEAKTGTQMKFSWWLVDAEGTQNKRLKDIDYTTGALENVIHGHLTLPQDWPKGKYKVEVYVNGNLDKTAPYTVE
jgi:hypothetical protein